MPRSAYWPTAEDRVFKVVYREKQMHGDLTVEKTVDGKHTLLRIQNCCANIVTGLPSCCSEWRVFWEHIVYVLGGWNFADGIRQDQVDRLYSWYCKQPWV
jgi:hypothetical protein